MMYRGGISGLRLWHNYSQVVDKVIPTYATFLASPFSCRLRAPSDLTLFRFRHRLLRGVKSDFGVSAVAERFFGRCAAAAERDPLLRRIAVAVRVFQFHFALHDVRAVL